jgi:hypothetical protein
MEVALQTLALLLSGFDDSLARPLQLLDPCLELCLEARVLE